MQGLGLVLQGHCIALIAWRSNGMVWFRDGYDMLRYDRGARAEFSEAALVMQRLSKAWICNGLV